MWKCLCTCRVRERERDAHIDVQMERNRSVCACVSSNASQRYFCMWTKSDMQNQVFSLSRYVSQCLHNLWSSTSKTLELSIRILCSCCFSLRVQCLPKNVMQQISSVQWKGLPLACPQQLVQLRDVTPVTAWNPFFVHLSKPWKRWRLPLCPASVGLCCLPNLGLKQTGIFQMQKKWLFSELVLCRFCFPLLEVGGGACIMTISTRMHPSASLRAQPPSQPLACPRPGCAAVSLASGSCWQLKINKIWGFGHGHLKPDTMINLCSLLVTVPKRSNLKKWKENRTFNLWMWTPVD